MKYYLIQNSDPNIKIEIDISDCPVDGLGRVSLDDVAFSAIDQLGYTICCEAKE